MKAGEEYAGMERREPDFTSLFLEHSGNTYFRSDWSERANFLHLHSGTMGAGHGHSDKLHIDLVVNGEDVLMDGGRFRAAAGVGFDDTLTGVQRCLRDYGLLK